MRVLLFNWHIQDRSGSLYPPPFFVNSGLMPSETLGNQMNNEGMLFRYVSEQFNSFYRIVKFDVFILRKSLQVILANRWLKHLLRVTDRHIYNLIHQVRPITETLYTAEADTNRSALQSVLFLRVCLDVITNRREVNNMCSCRLVRIELRRSLQLLFQMSLLHIARESWTTTDGRVFIINITRRSVCWCWPSAQSVVPWGQRSF